MPRWPWARWICPRDHAIAFNDDGYVADPASRYAAALQPHVVRLGAVLDGRCSVLLGEAGLGKSDALRQLRAQLTERRRGPVVTLDLGEYADATELAHDLFEAPAIRTWLAGEGALDLLLDSLDEGVGACETSWVSCSIGCVSGRSIDSMSRSPAAPRPGLRRSPRF